MPIETQDIPIALLEMIVLYQTTGTAPAPDIKFILLETGDRMLKEDGDELVLESL